MYYAIGTSVSSLHTESTNSQLTLGAHAQEGHGTCLVCVWGGVDLSVTTPVPTSLISTFKKRYVGVYLLFLLFNVWNFDKSFRSEVMV